jgi:NADH-quinone oxidoreductase subunit F
MSSICDQIMGNCLCVLGDAMAMPISSMIKHFRPEFEEHMERMQLEASAATELSRGPHAGPYDPLEPVGVATPVLG